MPSQTGPTLTQRRSGKSEPQTRASATKTVKSEKGAAIQIIIWGIAILAVGVGLALLVRNLTADTTVEDTNNDTINQQEESIPQEPEEIIEEEIPNEEEEEIEIEEPEQEIAETPPTNNTVTQDSSINDGLNTNTVTLSGYEYATFADKFVYTLKFANTTKYPTITTSVNEEEKKLTMVVNNIARDNIVGGQGTGSTQFADPRNVEHVDIKNTGNQTTFVFQLKKITSYRLYKVEGSMNVTLEISNN